MRVKLRVPRKPFHPRCGASPIDWQTSDKFLPAANLLEGSLGRPPNRPLVSACEAQP